MKNKLLIISGLIVAASLIGYGAYGLYQAHNEIDPNDPDALIKMALQTPELIPEMSWNLLYEYDYQNKVGPDELMALDGQIIKIPGYIVPLSDDWSKLDEFLLVPDGQSCIHVPPPPPNLIVSVDLREAVPMEEVYNPSWIYGIFRVEETFSVYGGAAFTLDAVDIEMYDLYGAQQYQDVH